MKSFSVSQQFQVTAKTLYCAWLNSYEHTKMTGADAYIKQFMYVSFVTWDGYIKGKTTGLIANEKIIQKWRTSDFKDEDPDSKVIILFKNNEEGCLLTIEHSKIPENQPDYEKGWVDFYFTPMLAYFSV